MPVLVAWSMYEWSVARFNGLRWEVPEVIQRSYGLRVRWMTVESLPLIWMPKPKVKDTRVYLTKVPEDYDAVS